MFKMLQNKKLVENLQKKELDEVDDTIGDFIDWYGAISLTLSNVK